MLRRACTIALFCCFGHTPTVLRIPRRFRTRHVYVFVHTKYAFNIASATRKSIRARYAPAINWMENCRIVRRTLEMNTVVHAVHRNECGEFRTAGQSTGVMWIHFERRYEFILNGEIPLRISPSLIWLNEWPKETCSFAVPANFPQLKEKWKKPIFFLFWNSINCEYVAFL